MDVLVSWELFFYIFFIFYSCSAYIRTVMDILKEAKNKERIYSIVFCLPKIMKSNLFKIEGKILSVCFGNILVTISYLVFKFRGFVNCNSIIDNFMCMGGFIAFATIILYAITYSTDSISNISRISEVKSFFIEKQKYFIEGTCFSIFVLCYLIIYGIIRK